jgi:hypothetical protein
MAACHVWVWKLRKEGEVMGPEPTEKGRGNEGASRDRPLMEDYQN